MSFYAIIRGPMGCGKSTIAERIAKKLKAKYIPIDKILDEHDLTTDKEAGYISQRSFIKVMKMLESTSPRTKVRGLKRGAFLTPHFVTQKGRSLLCKKQRLFCIKSPEPAIHPHLKRRSFLAF